MNNDYLIEVEPNRHHEPGSDKWWLKSYKTTCRVSGLSDTDCFQHGWGNTKEEAVADLLKHLTGVAEEILDFVKKHRVEEKMV